VLARLDPLKPSCLLSNVIVLSLLSPFSETVPFSGSYVLSIYPLNSYRFLVGGSQYIEQLKLLSPWVWIAVFNGLWHCLCFNARSPSRLEVCTKHSPLSADDIKKTKSAGRCSPSCKKTMSPHLMSAQRTSVKFDFKIAVSSLECTREGSSDFCSEMPNTLSWALTEHYLKFWVFLSTKQGLLFVNLSFFILF
jgi:hypothetical protein